MADWMLATDIAAQHHDVIARWQLGLIGIDRRTLERSARAHGFLAGPFDTFTRSVDITPVRRLAAAVLAYSAPRSGAARVAALEEAGHDRATAVAQAALTAGQRLCGPSAAWLHGIASATGEVVGGVWICLPRRTGHRVRVGIHLRYETTGLIEWKQGLPVCDPMQTLADLAVIDPAPFDVVVGRLHRKIGLLHARRIADPEEVGDWLEQAGPIAGAVRLHAAVGMARRELNHSIPEGTARAIVRDVVAPYGLTVTCRPMPIRQDGRVIAEADIAVRELRYDVEVDGKHHEHQRAKDEWRDAQLRKIRWTVDRFPTTLVEGRPLEFARAVDSTVQRLLAARTPEQG